MEKTQAIVAMSVGALALLLGCSGETPTPPGLDGPPPVEPHIDVGRILAHTLNDTAIVFPITYGETASYRVVMGDRGSFEYYSHKSDPTIASAPNQPYLELPGDTFVTTGWKRFDLGDFSVPSALLILEDGDTTTRMEQSPNSTASLPRTMLGLARSRF